MVSQKLGTGVRSEIGEFVGRMHVSNDMYVRLFFPALRIVFKSGQKGGMHSTVKLRKRNQDHDRETCKVHATGHLKILQ